MCKERRFPVPPPAGEGEFQVVEEGEEDDGDDVKLKNNTDNKKNDSILNLVPPILNLRRQDSHPFWEQKKFLFKDSKLTMVNGQQYI